MARVFTEGAEFNDTIFWSVINYSLVVITSPVRSGTYAYKGASGGGGGQNAAGTKVLDVALSEFYLKFAWNMSNITSVFRFPNWYKGSTELGSVRLNASTGKIEIYTGTATLVATGTTPLNPDQYYVIEIHVKIADAGGTIDVKVDGISNASFSGDTKPGADTNVDKLYWSGAVSGGIWYLDDLALNDVSGGVDDSWCGGGKVILLQPNGNGDANDFDGSDGNQVDNYLLVDELPHNSDTDYIESTTLDERDLYALENTGLVAGSTDIKRVWGEARAKDTGASGQLIAFVVKTGGTEYASADVALPGSYSRVIGADWLVNPNTSAAWTPSELDAAQSGPKVRS